MNNQPSNSCLKYKSQYLLPCTQDKRNHTANQTILTGNRCDSRICPQKRGKIPPRTRLNTGATLPPIVVWNARASMYHLVYHTKGINEANCENLVVEKGSTRKKGKFATRLGEKQDKMPQQPTFRRYFQKPKQVCIASNTAEMKPPSKPKDFHRCKL